MKQRRSKVAGGFTRRRGRGPTLYPVACAPQAWSSVTPLSLIQSVLGLSIDGDDKIDFMTPTLPDFLTKLSIDDLSCGGNSVDLDVQKVGEVTSVLARHRIGDDISVAVTT